MFILRVTRPGSLYITRFIRGDFTGDFTGPRFVSSHTHFFFLELPEHQDAGVESEGFFS